MLVAYHDDDGDWRATTISFALEFIQMQADRSYLN